MSDCCCQTIGADASVVRLCEEHHAYWKGDARLTSVSYLTKQIWPVKPDFSKAPEGVIENARERGVEVDQLFSKWIAGELTQIPEGIREDSRDLFLKLIEWWDVKMASKYHAADVMAQKILTDGEIAGTADIVPWRAVFDLKTTYDIEAVYALQVGAYCHLYEAEYGVLPADCGIIHLTKRQPIKLVTFDVSRVVSEFRLLRDFWRMTERYQGKKVNREKSVETRGMGVR